MSHNLTGTMPTELNYFSEIVVLNLFFNNLTGAIPDLSNLTKMEQLDLDDNQLSGKIPESIFNLPSLGKFPKFSGIRFFGRIEENIVVARIA